MQLLNDSAFKDNLIFFLLSVILALGITLANVGLNSIENEIKSINSSIEKLPQKIEFNNIETKLDGISSNVSKLPVKVDISEEVKKDIVKIFQSRISDIGIAEKMAKNILYQFEVDRFARLISRHMSCSKN